MADIETGNTWVSAQTLVNLAKAFDIEPDELLKPEKDSPDSTGQKDLIDRFSKDLAVVLKNSIDKSTERLKNNIKNNCYTVATATNRERVSIYSKLRFYVYIMFLLAHLSIDSTTDTLYFRGNGQNVDKWYTGDATTRYEWFYTDEQLQVIVEPVKKLMGQVNVVIIFMNNHAKGYAALNARKLDLLLHGR